MRSSIAAALFCAALCACVPSVAQPAGASATYHGRYRYGFEINDFVPCGTREKWWVTGEAELLHRAATTPPLRYGGPVYAELRGRVTERGRYGHLGAYTRELTIEQVLRTSPSIPADCQ